MTNRNQFSLAYSSCPNDTFIFFPLALSLIDTGDLRFNITHADVETLNKKAAEGAFDITKLSFAAFSELQETYCLLRTGAALGRGCGPLLVSLPNRRLSDSRRPKVAVPGLKTTAHFLFRLFLNNLETSVEPDIIPMPFEKIMPHVTEGRSDFGVIIHEGRFVYPDFGLDPVADLGRWWEDYTSLPIPLGCIAVKRRLATEHAARIEKILAQSLSYARANPDAGFPYIKAHAQELDDTVIKSHIDLYVNAFTENLGGEGEKAVRKLLSETQKAGLAPESSAPLFAAPAP